MIRALLDRLLSRGPTFEVRLDAGRHWYVRKVASNGRIEEHTQRYATKANAKRAAIRRASQTANAKWTVIEP